MNEGRNDASATVDALQYLLQWCAITPAEKARGCAPTAYTEFFDLLDSLKEHDYFVRAENSERSRAFRRVWLEYWFSDYLGMRFSDEDNGVDHALYMEERREGKSTTIAMFCVGMALQRSSAHVPFHAFIVTPSASSEAKMEELCIKVFGSMRHVDWHTTYGFLERSHVHVTLYFLATKKEGAESGVIVRNVVTIVREGSLHVEELLEQLSNRGNQSRESSMIFYDDAPFQSCATMRKLNGLAAKHVYVGTPLGHTQPHLSERYAEFDKFMEEVGAK